MAKSRASKVRKLLKTFTKIPKCSKTTIMDKVFEANSSFMSNRALRGKVQFLLFKRFLLVLKKKSFWEEDSTPGYNSVKFQDFLDLS